MKTEPEQHWEALEFEGDSRWELVRGVIESPHLKGSTRLRDFLLPLTACAIRETPEVATEQQIGIRVFQRSPGFNSSEDSIVRSQARLLRLKLSAYFNAEGASDPLIIEIPKGHYLPVFLPSKRAGEESAKEQFALIRVEEGKDVPLSGPSRTPGTERQRGWLALAGVALALLLCVFLAVAFRWQRQAAAAKPLRQLWGHFLAGDPPLGIYSK